jgi:hypothetical protein
VTAGHRPRADEQPIDHTMDSAEPPTRITSLKFRSAFSGEGMAPLFRASSEIEMAVLESLTAEIDDIHTSVRRRRSSRERVLRYRLATADFLAASLSVVIIYAGHAGGIAVAQRSSVTRKVLTVLAPVV